MEAKDIVNIGLEHIHPHPDNPRKDLGDLTELAESIKKNGILQNLTVIPKEGEPGEYTAIIGHRRCAAAKLAGAAEAPCRIVEGMTHKEQVSTMLEENMQRGDLTIWEQAQGFQMMLDLGETEDTIAEKTGFSKKTIRHRLNIAKLDSKTLMEKERQDGYQLTLTDMYELEKIKDSVTSNLEQTKENVKILVVSGERRGESKGRSKYNEIEIHRTNAPAKAHRIVHQWRPVIDYSERDIWEVLKRHKVNPHPCYRAGWNRCSCAMCIFSTPKLFAGIKEIYPEEFEALKRDEEILGFTLDNKCDLETFVGDAESCVYHGDFEALRSLITGEFTIDDVYVKGRWMYPTGAFHGAEGGPC